MVLAGWGGAVALLWVLGRARGVDVVTCAFRRVTNYPCATCGSTRVVFLLLQGELGRAMALNPLVTLLLLVTPALALAWGAARLAGWRGALIRTNRGSLVVALLLIAAVAANWVYVLRA